MDLDLLHTIERLGTGTNGGQRDCIDSKFDRQIPQARSERDPGAMKGELEAEFLTPPRSFELEWLNRVQQYVCRIVGVKI